MKSPSNFERLVLGCIDSYDSESRRIFQDFSRSTRFTFLCTAQTSKFQEKTRPKFCRNETISFSFSFSFQQKSMNFVFFLLNFDEILSEFHEKFQEIVKILNILRNSARKIRKMLEISGFCEEFHSSVSLFSIDSLVRTPRGARRLCRPWRRRAPVSGHQTLDGPFEKLYQRRFLRPNTHFAAFFEFYKILHFCTARNSEILVKFR